MPNPIVLVTGANRGLGLECVSQLVAQGRDVILTARRDEDAKAAAAAFPASRVTSLALDVADPSSIQKAAESLRAKGVSLDALVNNAGIALKGFDVDVARNTIAVNFFGALHVTDAMFPLLGSHAKIVMVSSGLGTLSHVSPALARRFSSDDQTRAGVSALVNEFVDSVAAGSHTAAGWPSSAYSVSKVAMNALTRVLAREWPNVRINAVSPGWARTRMGGTGAPRSVEVGAGSIVWAAILPPDGQTGGFFEDGQAIDW